MARFSDLPVEIHCHLIFICALQGHSVLSKYALLSRQHFHLARPLLHTSVDLADPIYGPDSLSKFIYNFAPHHRTDLQWISIAFRPSPPRCPFDELDESLSQIFSLLAAVSELEITLETPDIEESFLLTIGAIQRFTRLRSLTIRGQGGLAPRLDLILDALPKLGALHTLRLEGLTIVMPSWERGASSVRALEITDCLVCESSSNNMSSFINLFGPTLSALRLRDLSMNQALTSFCAPRLTRLWLSALKPEASQTKRAEEEDCVQHRQNFLNKLARVGPIRQLVSDKRLISGAGLLAFGDLEDVCQSASLVDFLGYV